MLLRNEKINSFSSRIFVTTFSQKAAKRKFGHFSLDHFVWRRVDASVPVSRIFDENSAVRGRLKGEEMAREI